MHLVYENAIKNLISFWSGKFKDLDHKNQAYTVDKAIWEGIGKATAQAKKTIPRAYGPAIPNMNEEGVRITADMYSFWFQFLGPVLLQNVFKNKVVYDHFILLVTLISKCLQLSITETTVEEIRQGFIDWVEDYERIYFQYTGERLAACVSTIHTLLHIADGIEMLGPVWVYWAFAMERFCGKLARLIRNRRFPFSQLDNQVLQEAQLTQIKNDFNLHRELTFNPKDGPRMSEYYLKPKPTITPALRTTLAKALVTRFSALDATKDDLIPLERAKELLLASEIEGWGRLRRLGGGDTMLANAFVSQQADDRRDATFIRFDPLVDAKATALTQKPRLEQDRYYGQLTHLFLIRVPVTPDLSIEEPTEIALAVIDECHKPSRHKASGFNIFTYTKRMAPQAVDIITIQGLVGRLYWDKKWAILDRNGDVACDNFAALDDGAQPTEEDDLE
ncbi:hypothetical protein FA13DRAFT_1756223 [Coprinellus micaceus]|uniref:DUF4218 domain-containing protein n=1 Tax=Coprinellus micaceus TaxID=71717 RepID=A0A4Y7SXY3_COPMI|nr:hypothetical protein FA13DRAFT_1756223 [Coprinellus micaceus]